MKQKRKPTSPPSRSLEELFAIVKLSLSLKVEVLSREEAKNLWEKLGEWPS